MNLHSGLGGNRKLWRDVEVTAIESLWTQAKAVRTKSDALELSIASMTADQLNALDVTDNFHWV